MAIPYKEWTAFHCATLRGEDAANMFGAAADWTNDHYETCMIGLSKTLVAGIFIRRDPLFKPDGSGFALLTSLDHIWKARFDMLFVLEINDYLTSWAGPHGTFAQGIYPEQWNPDLVTGKNYNGVNNWSVYPPQCIGAWGNITITPTDFPKDYEYWLPAYAGGVLRCYPQQTGFFRNGLHLYMGNFNPGIPANGESFLAHSIPQMVKVYYANAVVNSLSTYISPIAGGGQLVINGLGFDCDDAEIADGGPGTVPGAGFRDAVDEIYFVPLQGQAVPAAITPPAFTINSNSQITVASLPAMEAGTYSIMLKKINVGPAAELGVIDSYAGDFACDTNGRTRESSRLVFLVADEEPPVDPPEIRTKWKWKKGDTTIDRYYSPLDTRGDNFYDGRIKSVSPFTRSIDDKTGLFSVSDTSVTLANQDKEFSKLLAEYFLKNQIVEFYHGWGQQPEAWQTHVFQGVVDDYSLEGVHFDVAIKDITKKYFKIKVPQYICTAEATDYPNIHESGVGKVRPEVLGIASLIPAIASENSGAVEAVYVDTTTFSYLAANFSLNSITQVYSDNILQATPVDYVVAYRDGGRTYIDFTGAGDQGDNKITFNATGYSVGMWDSANGYIQNPAYIISFYLTQILGMPIAYLDMDSFDTLAALYTTAGWHQAGFLVIQSERDSMAVLQELLFTYGAKLWPAKDGRLTIGRKDITNFATDLFIFDQIDLYAPANRKYNLNEAVNFVNAKWNYAPAHSIHQDAIEDRRQASIDDYEKEMSPSSDWLFPWTTSQTLVEKRLTEELLKRSYGDKKIEFSVNIKFIDDLDIFTNFRFQDPFGLSSTGAGEYGHYYYIESLAYDFQSQKIDVVAIDMQWFIRQYLIIGDCSIISDDYLTATEHDRMYAYISDCATNRFSNGDVGKKVADCDVF